RSVDRHPFVAPDVHPRPAMISTDLPRRRNIAGDGNSCQRKAIFEVRRHSDTSGERDEIAMEIGAVALLVIANKRHVTLTEMGRLLVVVVLHGCDDVVIKRAHLVNPSGSRPNNLMSNRGKLAAYRYEP